MKKIHAVTWILAIAATFAASGCVVVVPSHHGMRSYWSHHLARR